MTVTRRQLPALTVASLAALSRVYEAKAEDAHTVCRQVAESPEWVELTSEDYIAVCRLCNDVQRLIWRSDVAGRPTPSESLPQPVFHALQGIVQLLDEISWWGVNGMPCPDGSTSELFDLAVKSSTP